MSENDAVRAAEDLGSFADMWEAALAEAEAERDAQTAQLVATQPSEVEAAAAPLSPTQLPPTPTAPMASAPLSPPNVLLPATSFCPWSPALVMAPVTPPWRRTPEEPAEPPPQWMMGASAAASSNDNWSPPPPEAPSFTAGPWVPAPINWNDPATIEIEKSITFAYGRKFKERGPPGPSEGGPTEWRFQKWRESSGRWGNRVGKNKAV